MARIFFNTYTYYIGERLAIAGTGARHAQPRLPVAVAGVEGGSAKLLTANAQLRADWIKDGMPADKGMKTSSAADIARDWQLEGGIGFLLRLLEARYDVLYQNADGAEPTSRRGSSAC